MYRWLAAMVCAGLALYGGVVVLNGRAATYAVPAELESAALKGAAGKTVVGSSSGGAAVLFGSTVSTGSKIIGYFTNWSTYRVKDIETSGSAGKLTHINYAFASPANGQCALTDAYADYQRPVSAADSVDGVADGNNVLKGNFNQLRKLKQRNPQLKLLMSVGGFTLSEGFTRAAANPAAFASSCYDLLNDSRWSGLFDGIDIDWEYPNACGVKCDSSGQQAIVNLMAALRARFGNQLITAAVTAGQDNINAANYGGAAQYIDWYNVMAYDFFGTWDARGPVAPHSPLNAYNGIPVATGYGDNAVRVFKSKGVPGSKLVLGVPFYGRGWGNVSGGDANNCRLGGSANGPAAGGDEPGYQFYKVLKNQPGTVCRGAGTLWKYNAANGTWWSYDDAISLAGKQAYRKQQGLAGVMVWDLSGDSNGELMTALYANR